MAEPSYWFREVPDIKRYPSLEGNFRCDAVVMGGGIAGLSAAYFLSRSGLRTALLEKNRIGGGDSGYNSAFATRFLDSVPATILLWEASEAGIKIFKDVIFREQIACDWEDVDGIKFSRSENLTDFIETYDAYREADKTLEYFEGWDASRVAGFPVQAAIRKKEEGQFHIRKFLIALAERVTANGDSVFEESEVIEISHDAKITVRTPKGSLTADWLFVASGHPPRNLFPAVADELSGAVTFVIQASYGRTKPPFNRSLFWDDLEPDHYLRWVNDTDIILGGEDRSLKDSPLQSNSHAALEEWLGRISSSAEFTVVNKWQGTVFYTPDTIPIISPHPGYGENTVFLTGWGRNGMTFGLLAGKIAADIAQSKKNPYQKLFSLGGNAE